jgi:hypothetical protein
MRMSKNLLFTSLLAFLLAIPLLRADGPVIDQGYDAKGAFVAELVDNPHNFPAEAFASTLTPSPIRAGYVPADLPVWSLVPAALDGEPVPGLAVRLDFASPSQMGEALAILGDRVAGRAWHDVYLGSALVAQVDPDAEALPPADPVLAARLAALEAQLATPKQGMSGTTATVIGAGIAAAVYAIAELQPSAGDQITVSGNGNSVGQEGSPPEQDNSTRTGTPASK